MQQAVRFGLFHALQAGARSEGRAIAAKGLTGPGYDGHAFWDSEMFVLPVLTATAPAAAADALRWRHSIIDLAVERAQTLGHRARRSRGARSPARSAAATGRPGPPRSTSTPTSLAAVRYVQWTGDTDFDRESGLPILVQTARLWMTLGYYGAVDGKFHIEGVTGPDEYSALVADNTFTNLMAARNLRYAALSAQRWVREADELGVDPGRDRGLAAGGRGDAPADGHRPACRSSTAARPSASCGTSRPGRRRGYPLLLNYPYFDLYRKQVAKQADLVLACTGAVTRSPAEQKGARSSTTSS